MAMFFHNELDPASAMYHDVFSYRIQAIFDKSKLELALNTWPAPSHAPDLFPYRGVLSAAPVRPPRGERAIRLEDLHHLTTDEQDHRLVDWIEIEKRRPFDRLRARWFDLCPTPGCRSFQLIISFHHACLDGWSWRRITEIARSTSGLLNDLQPVILHREPLPRFRALERQCISSSKAHEFWTKKLDGATAPDVASLPPDNAPRWPRTIARTRSPIEENVFAASEALGPASSRAFKDRVAGGSPTCHGPHVRPG